jgi:hypothetical protein
MDITLELKIDFGPVMPLSEVEGRRHDLPEHGVYLLVRDYIVGEPAGPFDASVVYIGKALSESMFSRCRKQFWDILNVKTRSRENKAAPAKARRAYAEGVNFDASATWTVAAKMDAVVFHATPQPPCAFSFSLLSLQPRQPAGFNKGIASMTPRKLKQQMVLNERNQVRLTCVSYFKV